MLCGSRVSFSVILVWCSNYASLFPDGSESCFSLSLFFKTFFCLDCTTPQCGDFNERALWMIDFEKLCNSENSSSLGLIPTPCSHSLLEFAKPLGFCSCFQVDCEAPVSTFLFMYLFLFVLGIINSRKLVFALCNPVNIIIPSLLWLMMVLSPYSCILWFLLKIF